MPVCILIGIIPPDLECWELVKEKTRTVSNSSEDNDHEDEKKSIQIDWRDVAVVHDEGVPTLVVEGIMSSSIAESQDGIVQHVSKLLLETTSKSFSCELWASAPAPIPLQPSIGYDQILKWNDDDAHTDEKSHREAWTDWGTQRMKEWGMFIQENVLSEDQVMQLSTFVDTTIAEIENKIKACRPEIKFGQDTFFYKEIASRNAERFDLRLDMNAEIVTFVEENILHNTDVSGLLEKILGTISEIDFDTSVVYSRPGACAQGWHADGSHQKGAIDAGWDSNGWKTHLANAYALCLFIPLIDLNHDVGYTQFWPGSHRSSNFIGFGPVAEMTNSTCDGICKAGDCVWYDYRLLHRGMPNKSDRIRPVLQVIFKKRWYIEKANYGTESIEDSRP